MTYRTDSSYSVDESYDEDDEEPRRGLLSWILIVAHADGNGQRIGPGLAHLWRRPDPAFSLTSSTAPAAVAVAQKPSRAGRSGRLAAGDHGFRPVNSSIAGGPAGRDQAAVGAGIGAVEQAGADAASGTSAQAAIPVPPSRWHLRRSRSLKQSRRRPNRPHAKPVEARSTEPKPLENRPSRTSRPAGRFRPAAHRCNWVAESLPRRQKATSANRRDEGSR